MKPGSAARWLWLAAACASLGAVARWTRNTAPPVSARIALPPAPGIISRGDSAELEDRAAALRARNPFRTDRRPAEVLFQLSGPTTPAPAIAVPVVRPTLVLAGLVGGPPWHALVEGVPGREGGVLLGLGDQIGGVRVLEFRNGAVVLAGYDTTWVLSPRNAWP